MSVLLGKPLPKIDTQRVKQIPALFKPTPEGHKHGTANSKANDGRAKRSSQKVNG